jgi:CRP/FNR family transcriptional regulator, anaerobic regulatory protein
MISLQATATDRIGRSIAPSPAPNGARARTEGKCLHGWLDEATVRRMPAKEFVFMEGDAADHIYRIESGAVSLFKMLPDGRRQILGFGYPGDFIGLGVHEEHIMNAQTIKPTRISSMPISALHRVATSDPSLSFALYQAIAEELAATRHLMMTTGHRTASERVATFLFVLWRRRGGSSGTAQRLELPMTRADIADFLGLTIETVSRTFTKLKNRGLIDLPQSSQVELLDIDELQRVAEGVECL